MKINNALFFKYTLSGVANTLISYSLYLILIKYFPYQLSYAFAFLIGLFISGVLNKFYVFDSRKNIKYSIASAAICLIQFIICQLSIMLWVEVFNGAKLLAPLVVVAISHPFFYIINKKIFAN